MKTNLNRSTLQLSFWSLTFILFFAQMAFAMPDIKFAAFGEFLGEPAIDINGESLHINDDDPVVRLGGKELTILDRDAEGKQLIAGGIPTEILDGTHLLTVETDDGTDEMDLTLVAERPQGLELLIGPQGAAGVNGIAGTNGLDGTDGAVVEQGAAITSATGYTGLNIFPVENTAGGTNALDSNTTGANNSAFGSNALTANTAGNDNTATGRRALFKNTTGNLNTATGVSALRDNTTGHHNTATGSNALIANTTGQENTATGRSALLKNITGNFNTAGGDSALRENTSGNENTAAGRNSLFNNTTGNFNTAMGNSALLNNTAGSNNTALGVGAGLNLNDGDSNLYLGSPGPAAPGPESETVRVGDNQTRAFIQGIRDVKPDLPDELPVVIDSNGQLGTLAAFPGSPYTGLTPITVDNAANTIGLNPATRSRDLLSWDGRNWIATQPQDAYENRQPFLGINYIIALVGTYPSRSQSEPLIAEIVMFAGNFAPRGWAFCEGQLLAISSHTALFSLLGTTYVGDGRTNFNLPDLRGRVPIQQGTGPGLPTVRLGERAGSFDVIGK